MKYINEIGNKYGRWNVVGKAVVTGKYTNWIRECACGVKKEVRGSHLRSGKTNSCGCLSLENLAVSRITHGFSNHPLYKKWSSLKERCYRPENNRYASYGARGIQVCDSWKNDANAFIVWCLENGYKEGLQIDRIDNDGDYCPSNCRFVTQKENSRNKTTNRIVEYNGEELTLSEFFEKYASHCNKNTAKTRFYSGWSLDRIVNTPTRAISWGNA